MNVPDIIIAIDGYSSTGKSTFAKLVAREFGFLYLDSGAMYRGVTLVAMESGFIAADGSIDLPALQGVIGSLDLHFRQEEGATRLYLGERCIEQEIRTLEEQRRKAFADAALLISRLPEEKMARILELRYLDLLPWEEITDGMDISASHVFRLHQLALDILTPPPDPGD